MSEGARGWRRSRAAAEREHGADRVPPAHGPGIARREEAEGDGARGMDGELDEKVEGPAQAV